MFNDMQDELIYELKAKIQQLEKKLPGWIYWVFGLATGFGLAVLIGALHEK